MTTRVRKLPTSNHSRSDLPTPRSHESACCRIPLFSGKLFRLRPFFISLRAVVPSCSAKICRVAPVFYDSVQFCRVFLPSLSGLVPSCQSLGSRIPQKTNRSAKLCPPPNIRLPIPGLGAESFDFYFKGRSGSGYNPRMVKQVSVQWVITITSH